MLPPQGLGVRFVVSAPAWVMVSAHCRGYALRRWLSAQIQRLAVFARGRNTLSPNIPKHLLKLRKLQREERKWLQFPFFSPFFTCKYHTASLIIWGFKSYHVLRGIVASRLIVTLYHKSGNSSNSLMQLFGQL